MADSLPVPVTEKPYWRVNFRPGGAYVPELIPTLAKCFEIVEQTKVSLRGWDYPHLSRLDTERGHGSNWIASWSDFMGHLEYWRFYQSGQFLHLFGVREATQRGVRENLEQVTRGHLQGIQEVDWSKVPGFMSIINFLYTVTEIFEFAARLCEKYLDQQSITISVELKGIRGFVLTTDWERAWWNYYAATENVLGRTWDLQRNEIISSSSECSLLATQWFFERFGWLDVPLEALRKDQQDFLKRRL